MFRPHQLPPSRPAPPGRRGAILIVVLALLALFATIGLAFVFYADGEATVARYTKQVDGSTGNGGPPAPPDPTAVAEEALGQFTVDTDNVASSARGHSLSRAIFGWSGWTGTVPADRPQHNVPYNGIGSFSDTATALPGGIPRQQWVHYVPVQSGASYVVVDPEWTGTRAPTDPAPALTAPNGRTYVPKNAAYTYPDLNNFYLAALSPVTGEVLVPSFFRPWHFNPGNTTVATRLAPWNPGDTAGAEKNTDWKTPEGRAKILRPRPVDQLTAAERGGAADDAALYAKIDELIKKGEIIPYPAANADGSYSGDVQNFVGGVGAQKNDSILIDVGLPPQKWNNKWIKPLVAVLISDLDGLIDVNRHGNTRNGGNHVSFHGFGPWEVNVGKVTRNATTGAADPAEANAVVGGRYGTNGVPLSRNRLNRLLFDKSGARLPLASLVNWDGTGTPGTPAIQLPNFPNTAFATHPSYPTTPGAEYYDDNVTGPSAADPMTAEFDKYLNHPGLYNPSDWAALAPGTALPADPFSYPISDLKRLRLKYAGDLDGYQQMVLNAIATRPTISLVGSYAPPGKSSNQYRLDPAHATRLLYTTLTAGLDRPGLMPNYNSGRGSTVLTTGTLHPAFPGGFPDPLVNPPAAAAGQVSDFASATDARNARAALGGVDLNRPLADYRTNTTQALSSTNAGNSAAAWADRQQLARDVFARLVVAAGANATVYTADDTAVPPTYKAGDVKITVASGQDYDALRYLAQLAANIVDYTDKDDVSTAFVWNPVDATKPLDAANFADEPTTKLRVVFGVEKPRLVVNEAYAEVTNDPAETLPNSGDDSAMNNFRVRFWVELLNPTSPPYAGGVTDGVLGDGSVTLFDGTNSPYKLVIAADDPATAGLITARTADNVTGSVASPKLTFDFRTAGADLKVVAPADGAWKYATNSGSTKGFVVAAASKYTTPHTSGGAAVEFDPDPASGPYIVGKPAPAAMTDAEAVMEYEYGKLANADLNSEAERRKLARHVVLLRRLANPYLPHNAQTNPYITVDVMDWVPAHDAVVRGADGTNDKDDRTPRASLAGPGFLPLTGTFARAAVGKVQPYAGFADADNASSGLPALKTFPASCVLPQAPATAPPAGHPKHTLGRHNGTTDAAPTAATTVTNTAGGTTGLKSGETIMAPFDWFVHFDRPLINQLELLHVHAVKPHEVTQYFVRPPVANPGTDAVRKGYGLAPWLGISSGLVPVFSATTGLPILADMTNLRTNNGLYRALELLRVKPWTYGVPFGGRLGGRININTIQDKRILDALLDRQAGNIFTQAEADALWTSFITGANGRTVKTLSRSEADPSKTYVVPVPGKTLDDDPASYAAVATTPVDRPFKSFGVAELPPPGVSGYPNPLTGYNGIQDTLLRTDANGVPLAWVPSSNTEAAKHPYLQAEMARKMFNNVTTVSNAFAVHLTVVYHEVRMNGGTTAPSPVSEGGVNRYLLGKEAYRENPGDMRSQYFAVVDRSKLMLTPGGTTLEPKPIAVPLDQPVNAGAGARLRLANAVFTAAVASPPSPAQLTVYADGQQLTFAEGASNKYQLVVGAGANQEVVTVTLDGTTSELVTDSTTDLKYAHAAGESVGNAVPGNPGPVPTSKTFDRLSNQNSVYQGVVPYFVRVR